MRLLVKTKDMPREEWLELRRKSIGGSDAAVIVGLNKWRSQYTLWADKQGLLPPQEDNEAMRIGRDLEQYVANRFCEATGKKVRRKNTMYLHDDFDFISANVDREIVGENAGLECKTTNIMAKSDFAGGEIPLYYYCQCVHYMAVMGYSKMYLAVLVLGKAFYWFEIQRDEKEIQALINAEVEWWNKYILGNAIPDIDGSDSTTETLGTLYPNSQNGFAILVDVADIIERYKQAKSKESECKKIADECKNKITALMEECERAKADGYTITYKTQSRTTIDSKMLKAEMPDIYNKYCKTTTSRVFKIKEEE